MNLTAKASDWTLNAEASPAQQVSYTITAFYLTDPQGNRLTDPQGNYLIGYFSVPSYSYKLSAKASDYTLNAE